MNKPKSGSGKMKDPRVLLAICGAVTGGLNATLMFYDVGESKHLFGVIFGLSIAAALMHLKLANVKQALFIVVTFAASWEIAFQAAIYWADFFDEMYQVGLPAGALGACIVALGFAVVFSPARNAMAFLRTVAIGAGAGMLLGLDSPYYLFVVWQTLVAASLGWSLSNKA